MFFFFLLKRGCKPSFLKEYIDPEKVIRRPRVQALKH